MHSLKNTIFSHVDKDRLQISISKKYKNLCSNGNKKTQYKIIRRNTVLVQVQSAQFIQKRKGMKLWMKVGNLLFLLLMNLMNY